MEKVDWTVEGMTCSNCALTISRFLEKEGMEDIKVNPIDGTVSFKTHLEKTQNLKTGIEGLGYHVKDGSSDGKPIRRFFTNHKQRFFFCLPFTAILLLHMFEGLINLHWLMNPWIQLALCLPVFFVGMNYFGRSAVKSLRNGMPNMNVLIALGSLAAFVYSLTGALLGLGETYLFFESSASIITLVFLGNHLEEVSMQSTQREIHKLASSQKVMANMIAFDEKHEEHIFPVENTMLKTGDLILIKTGEQVPVDCKILWGEGLVNEAIITGESSPVTKHKKDKLIGGSVLEDGIIKAQVTATGNDTVLSGILKMVQDAQGEKPPIQRLADKISALFVPLVIGIAALTFLLNYFLGSVGAGDALMRSIAVLVISCPCALGLATPAAIAVGLGRSARMGILFRDASSLESFKNIKQVVFDKTGTLTTGKFSISKYHHFIEEDEFKMIVYSLERFSNHPIGKSIAREWKQSSFIKWKKIVEIKGTGPVATDEEGNIFEAGSFRITDVTAERSHNVYILKNKKMIGWIDVEDEIRPEAKDIISWFKKKNIKTILLSGDSPEKCRQVAGKLGIDEIYAEHSPKEKMEKIASLDAIAPTAMVGDGINDGPALAKATLGISISDASHITLQSADVILVASGLEKLPKALGLGKETFITIKQNLFWAFFYNIFAIPVAALGFLTPTFSALAMAGSDVVLALNSIRLFTKKIN